MYENEGFPIKPPWRKKPDKRLKGKIFAICKINRKRTITSREKLRMYIIRQFTEEESQKTRAYKVVFQLVNNQRSEN